MLSTSYAKCRQHMKLQEQSPAVVTQALMRIIPRQAQSHDYCVQSPLPQSTHSIDGEPAMQAYVPPRFAPPNRVQRSKVNRIYKLFIG